MELGSLTVNELTKLLEAISRFNLCHTVSLLFKPYAWNLSTFSYAVNRSVIEGEGRNGFIILHLELGKAKAEI